MNNYLKPETRNSKLETLFRNSRGFTLIEVMMASVIFALGILAILGMQITAMNSSKYGNQMQVATSLATGAIENLMLLIPTDPALVPADASAPHQDSNNPVNEEGQAGGSYTRSWTVENHPDPDGNFVSKTIVMSIDWTDGWGKSREVTMDYLYYVMQ